MKIAIAAIETLNDTSRQNLKKSEALEAVKGTGDGVQIWNFKKNVKKVILLYKFKCWFT